MILRARTISILLATLSLLVLPALADRTSLKTGWNMFTVQQDIEMGRHLALEAESTMSLVGDSYANTYIQALGSQLAIHAPAYKYPYKFKILNDRRINSFALPGGFIYVTSGLVEAVRTEPQLAGILAHQMGHVVMRHGTQQVSQAYSAETRNTSRVSVGDAIAQLDIAFDPDSIVLKYSADAERQADLAGTQILYDAGFDPRQMTVAFQNIEKEAATLTTEFFGSHPRVSNRAVGVRREIQNMGGLRSNMRGDSPDLHKTQDLLRGESTSYNSVMPSTRTISYRGREFDFRYPENWRVSENGDVITVAPSNGLVNGELAYGMRMAIFEPQDGFFGQNTFNLPDTRSTRMTLSRATDQLLDELQRSNPNMQVIRTEERRLVDGESSMAMELTNDSPEGGRETDWLVAVLRSDGLLHYFVGVAPEREFNRYRQAFEQIISSIRFNN